MKPSPSIAATLFAAADKLRGNMDAAEYKHVALGLIFLKYISDRFDARLAEVKANPEEAFLLDDPDAARDLIIGEGIFFVPEWARWTFLKENATSTKPTIGELIDQAMIAIEAENSTLKGVLTKNYARQELDQTKLGEVLKLFSDIKFEDAHHGQDVLGRVYEYFLGEFAKLEGKRGGQYYTAGCVVKLLVAMLEPFKGRVYDPCCGSGGMFVQSERFVEEHAGRNVDPRQARDQIAVYGQESNATTWRLAKMNLAIRGIEANLGSKWADTFHEDLHKGLMAKYVLAKELSTAFAWLWCSANIDTFLAVAGGSTFPEISKGTLRKLPMVVPTADVSRAFAACVDPVVARLVELARESDRLAALRDTLLPRLISGELRIKNGATKGEAA